MIKRGEIYYADLNPVIGSEQGGVRPIVVLQNAWETNTALPSCRGNNKQADQSQAAHAYRADQGALAAAQGFGSTAGTNTHHRQKPNKGTHRRASAGNNAANR